MASRPTGFVNADKVLKVIETSINSAYNWRDETNNAFDTEERIYRLEELLEIIIMLKWRYGDNSVRFKFTKQKVDNVIDITEIFPEEATNWANRVLIDEKTNGTTLVYIRF